MEIISISNEIEKKIKALEQGRKILKERAEQKAQTLAEYERKLAVTIISLQNGQSFELDGQYVKEPPATTTEKIARGICWKEKLDMEQAEAGYKAGIVSMQSLEAELNGYQSIFRYLSEK